MKLSAFTLRIPQLLAYLPSLVVSWIELDGVGDCVESFRETGFHTECCGQIHPCFRITRRGLNGQTEVLFGRSEVSIA
jgi:hypothetical protein